MDSGDTRRSGGGSDGGGGRGGRGGRGAETVVHDSAHPKRPWSTP